MILGLAERSQVASDVSVGRRLGRGAFPTARALVIEDRGSLPRDCLPVRATAPTPPSGLKGGPGLGRSWLLRGSACSRSDPLLIGS
jgi:hypothetical protein